MSRVSRWVLRRCLGEVDSEILLSELDEEHEQRVERDGEPVADRWRRQQHRSAVWHAVAARIRRDPDPVWRRELTFREIVSMREGFHTVGQDLKFGMRAFRRRPLFSALAVGTLGLGIGASTTLFSAVNGVLLQPLPYDNAERLVQVGLNRGSQPQLRGLSISQLVDLMDQDVGLDAVAAARGSSFDLIGDGEPERVTVSRVSPEFFRILGAEPALGRGFAAAEHEVADAPVAIISHGLWQRRWGGDPEVVGKTFRASEEFVEGIASYTIVGIASAGFVNPAPLARGGSPGSSVEVWMPLHMNPAAYADSRWHWRAYAVARVAEGQSLTSVSAALPGASRALAAAFPDRYELAGQPLTLAARPLLEVTVGDRRRDLLILLGATGLLLLIACSNVGGLLLARASDRGKEMGIRAAMGARKLRLVRQLLTESVVLGVAGGLVGIVLAYGGVLAFKIYGPADFPRIGEVSVDPRALLFASVLACGAGLLFGLAPAFFASRGAVGECLRAGDRGSTAGTGIGRFRAGLVAGEIALALMLLTGSGLLSRSLLALQSVDPGIEPDGLVMMQVNLPASYATDGSRRGFFDELTASLAGLPGSRSVSHIENPPMGTSIWYPWIYKEGSEERESQQAAGHAVGPGYFATMGIEVVAGRRFAANDDQNGAPVAIVNEVMARDVWPGESPLGKTITFGSRSEDPPLTVVGVSEAIRQDSLAADESWEIYQPYAQRPYTPRAYMVVKTEAGVGAVAHSMREAVWAIDPNIPVPEITTMDSRIATTLHLPRFRTLLLAASFALSRFLESLLFGVTSTDITTYVIATVVLALLALLATFVPASRAARVDPVTALRHE